MLLGGDIFCQPGRGEPLRPRLGTPQFAQPNRNEPLNQNEQHLYNGSRWVLYHGTTTYRLRSILKDGRLSRQGIGEQKISLTTERSVADYFSNVALHGD
jgi:hypothetical protein